MSRANTQLTHSENLYRISCNGDRSKPHCNPTSSVDFCVSSIALQFCPYLKIILDPSNTHSYTHLVGSLWWMQPCMYTINIIMIERLARQLLASTRRTFLRSCWSVYRSVRELVNVLYRLMQWGMMHVCFCSVSKEMSSPVIVKMQLY